MDTTAEHIIQTLPRADIMLQKLQGILMQALERFSNCPFWQIKTLKLRERISLAIFQGFQRLHRKPHLMTKLRGGAKIAKQSAAIGEKRIAIPWTDNFPTIRTTLQVWFISGKSQQFEMK